MPVETPAYADGAARERGERLLEAWLASRAAPAEPSVTAELESARRALRQGPLLHPGEIISDRYRLLSRLRDGVMASSWRAWDLEASEPVAIKVLQARFLAEPETVAQFFAAAERMAGLEHPGVPRVRAPGLTWEGFPLFVTDPHGDATFEARVQLGLDRWTAVQVVVDAGRALARAHAAGVFHRDVNPGNVYVGDGGAAWLVDFDLSPPSALQMGGAYQAPESMEPGATPTARADVYALAMTLLFALHGQALPFWVIRDPERLIKAVSVPEPVREAIRSAVNWDPDARTATVEGFLDEALAPLEVLQALADAAQRAGRHEVAADHYWQLVARGDGHPELRVGLARALAARGEHVEATNQLMLALRDERASDLDAILVELRALSERTGDWGPLANALSARAEDPASPRDALLLEVARIEVARGADADDRVYAWQRALDAHTTRAQACEALRGLLAVHHARAAWEPYVSVARELVALVDGPERAELQHTVGRVFLDHLGDQQSGLLWLERARDAGFDQADLAPTLERIRSSRGDWPQVIALMEEQARGQEGPEAAGTLRRAARIALYGTRDAARASELLTLLVTRVGVGSPWHAEAASWLARRALDNGDALIAVGLLDGLPMRPHAGAGSVEVARWLVDNATLAGLLVAEDRPADARTRLRAGLEIAPGHLATLRALAALELDEGDLSAAEELWDRALTLVGGSGHVVEAEARSALLDLAWVRGDLERAMDHAQALVTARPDDADAWWAVSKVALWSLRAASDESPWMRATPLYFTPQEALARLLGGVVDAEAFDRWLRLDKLGAAVADLVAGRPALEVAAVATDLLLRRGLVGPTLFERLGDVFPEAGVSVEGVRWLWCEPSLDGMFPVAESYRWCGVGGAGARSAEFDPRIHRTVLHRDPPVLVDPPAGRPALAALRSEAAWEVLFTRAPGGVLAIEASMAGPSSATPQLAIDRPRRLVLQLDHAVDGSLQVVVESDVVQLSELLGDGEGVTLQRLGGRLYLVGSASLNGVPTEEARLANGDQVQVGGRGVRVLLLEANEALPEPPRPVEAPESTDPARRAASLSSRLTVERPTVIPAEPAAVSRAAPPAVAVAASSDLDGSDDDADLDEDEGIDEVPPQRAAPRLSVPRPQPLGLTPRLGAASIAPAAAVAASTRAESAPTQLDDLDLGEFIAQEDDPTHDLREPPPALPRAAVFHRREGSEEMVPFDADLFVIGRNPSDDVFVEDPGVGFVYRLHQSPEGYRVEEALPDGTSEERPLRDGDSLSVGETVYVFRILDAERARTPAPPPVRNAVTPALPMLVLDDGSTHGRIIPIQRDSFTIGRGRKNDLQLANDAKISRHHCTLVRTADGVVRLRDNSSSNGTYVNGRKIREHVLQVGDAVAVGDHLFEFRLGRGVDESQYAASSPPSELTPDEERDRSRQPTEVISLSELADAAAEGDGPKPKGRGRR